MRFISQSTLRQTTAASQRHHEVLIGALYLALRQGHFGGFCLTDFEVHRARFHIARLQNELAVMGA